MKVDWLVIGAGFSGCVLAERIAKELDQKVMIIEKRDHIGGNAYDCYDANDILVHKYGPHLFHTNSKKVWDYLSTFTEWTPYQHRVLAVVEGRKVPVPFNLNSLEILFPKTYSEKMERLLIEKYGLGSKVPILTLKKDQQEEIRNFANYVYQNIFLGYTSKQWGMKPEELDPSVTGRVPVYISKDDRYFQDKYQAVPKHGYTEMFRNMLKHPNIKLLLNTDIKEIEGVFGDAKKIYTGPIDSYFNYKHGTLPYRSLKFNPLYYGDRETFQETAQVNYPNDFDFTRMTEYKKITGQNVPGTTVIIEQACPYHPEMNEPYYPIPKKEYHQLYRKYAEEAKALQGKVFFIGRLAEYKYYNMDQVVARALHVFEKEVQPIYSD
ncbi:UDP-galactopyranose mutase [Alkalihalobacillus sp. AL-G]|uniref:UDP-galactopyranose mutase n=1 Tax=Alkalihalobacillus sp. AL-G TaxID=2926399 RepID=UPI00272C9CAD|nr:UDP-galactopyranose mutase [Alkalihalobacillus sp. AL-G]WLD94942.1 UDP-galactopyranose mutase [Alkalihalobacillus sp. AL-G]